MEWIRAQDVENFVSEIFAAGEQPVPRSLLNGLRLKQVLDAIKITMAQHYFECLDGSRSIEQYEQMKSHWSFLLVSLPVSFTRDEEWEAAKHLEPKLRQQRLMSLGASWILDSATMNEEELEFHNVPENLRSFLEYVEKMAKHVKHPLEHVLGHLSHDVIYIDDLIPVI